MAVASTAHNNFRMDYLDESIIDGLTEIMSDSVVHALLSEMESDVRLRLDRLSEIHVARGSLEVIAQDSHDLRSMGGNFGLTELAVRAGVVERAARSGCVDTVREAVPSLISVGAKSLNALFERSKLHGGGAS